KASDLLLKNPEVARYLEALKEDATKKAKRRIHQQTDRAVTIVVATMEGDIRSRLQFDAAVKVLELNGIVSAARPLELDIGSRLDNLIKELAGRRPSKYLAPGGERRTERGVTGRSVSELVSAVDA